MSSHIVPLNTQLVRETNKRKYSSLKKIKQIHNDKNNLKEIKQKNPYDQVQSLIRSSLLKIQQEEITNYEFQYLSKGPTTISNTSFRSSFRNDILRFSGEDTLFTATFLGARMTEEIEEIGTELSESSEEGTMIVIEISSSSDEEEIPPNSPINQNTELGGLEIKLKNDPFTIVENTDSSEEENIESEGEESATSTETSEESSDDEPFFRKKSKRVTVNNEKRAKYPAYNRKSFEFSPIEASSDVFGSSELVLKDYQLEAINFIFKNYCDNRPCILGHEMGLGKTIISLSTLNTIHKKLEVFGPFLIVVPLITLPNWEREAKKWLPHFKLHTAWGTKIGNSKNQSLDSMVSKYYNSISNKNPLLVLTTYEFLKERTINSKRWACVVFDEAHKLKSQKSQWRAFAKNLKKDYMLLLTGTPMQNSPEELWSLLNLIDKKKFPSYTEFEKKYGELDSESKIEDLKTDLAPYLLRRTKAQVLNDEMPPKEEILIEIELSSIQKTIYRALIERKVHFLRRQFSSKQDLSYIVNNLRYCCDHPCLISGMEEYLRDEEKRDEKSILIHSSSKMVVVHKLLKKFRDTNEKALILSQFLDMLNILEDYMQREKIPYVRIDGSTPSEERQRCIDKFQTDPDCRVFLLSTKIGQGINLTAGNHVIIFDSDFNPFNDSQAAARCHRIGQTKKVFVYRLITKDSYEKYIISRASKKLGREKLVLADSKTSDDDIAAEEMQRMIKYGVYSMFLNKENNVNKDDELLNTDIDKILEESSKIGVQGEEDGLLVDTMNRVTGNDRKLPEKVSEKQTTNEVIKSVYFVPVEEVSDIPLDDPNFWDKAFPDYCDIYTLESRLADEKPFEAQEFSSYFKKLEIVVSEAIVTKQKVSEDTEKLSVVIVEDKKGLPTKTQLHTFLLKLINNNYNPHHYCLQEEHRTKIMEWIDLLETKTLRNRKVWNSSLEKKKIQQKKPQISKAEDISSQNDTYVLESDDTTDEEEFECNQKELEIESELLNGITKKAPAKKKQKLLNFSSVKPSHTEIETPLPHKEAHQKQPKSHKKELTLTTQSSFPVTTIQPTLPVTTIQPSLPVASFQPSLPVASTFQPYSHQIAPTSTTPKAVPPHQVASSQPHRARQIASESTSQTNRQVVPNHQQSVSLSHHNQKTVSHPRTQQIASSSTTQTNRQVVPNHQQVASAQPHRARQIASASTTQTNRQVVPNNQSVSLANIQRSHTFHSYNYRNLNQNSTSFQQAIQTMDQNNLLFLREHYTNTYTTISNGYHGSNKQQLLSNNQTVLQIINNQIYRNISIQQARSDPQYARAQNNNNFNIPSTNTNSMYQTLYTQSDGLRSVTSSSTTIQNNSTTLSNTIRPNNIPPNSSQQPSAGLVGIEFYRSVITQSNNSHNQQSIPTSSHNQQSIPTSSSSTFQFQSNNSHTVHMANNNSTYHQGYPGSMPFLPHFAQNNRK